MAKLVLRPAKGDECAALTELALRSKAHWGYDAAFMAACREELMVTPEQLAVERIIVAERQGRAVGLVASRSLTPRRAAITLMFVEPDCMRQGVGGALLAAALAELDGGGIDEVEVAADPGAEGFYSRHGFWREGTVPSQSIPGRSLPFLCRRRPRA